MTYEPDTRKQIIGGAIIFALIVIIFLIAIGIVAGELLGFLGGLPREFGATCQNVEGGDLCRITF